jgi:integrase
MCLSSRESNEHLPAPESPSPQIPGTVNSRDSVVFGRRLSPHTIRHTTAVHLLRAGVDINTIRAWLGHVSLDTTHIYAEVDLEMKAKALASVDLSGLKARPERRSLPSLVAFLKAL